MPPVSFSIEEASALLLMEALTAKFAGKSIQASYSNAFNKVKATLRTSQKQIIENLASHIKALASSDPGLEYLPVLQHAISFKNIIEITYKANGKLLYKGLVEPIGLIFYSLNWHMIAWCNQEQAFQDFQVAGLLQVKNTDQSFIRSRHIDLDQYVKNFL